MINEITRFEYVNKLNEVCLTYALPDECMYKTGTLHMVMITVNGISKILIG